VHLYNTPTGEKVCGDGDHPDTVCVEQHTVNFKKDPRMWTEEDEMGTNTSVIVIWWTPAVLVPDAALSKHVKFMKTYFS